MDVKNDFLHFPFAESILGSQLLLWSTLLDNPTVHSIWYLYPVALTCQWLSTLRDLLHIFHRWIKANQYHLNKGFYTATDELPSHVHLQYTSSIYFPHGCHQHIRHDIPIMLVPTDILAT
jgi:hypothetical protein